MVELATSIGDVLAWLARYVQGVGLVIWYALSLNRDLLVWVQAQPQGGLLAMGVLVVAGASTLLGQSVMLFVNRVRRGRFFISLVANGLLLIVEYLVVAFTIRLMGGLLYQVTPEPGVLFRTVALSTAPLAFGFLVLIPYLGTAIGRVLIVWSLLIMLSIVRFNYGVGFVAALVCVGAAWLLMLLLSNTVGKPVLALRNRIWRRIVGSDLNATADDILLAYARERSGLGSGGTSA